MVGPGGPDGHRSHLQGLRAVQGEQMPEVLLEAPRLGHAVHERRQVARLGGETVFDRGGDQQGGDDRRGHEEDQEEGEEGEQDPATDSHLP